MSDLINTMHDADFVVIDGNVFETEYLRVPDEFTTEEDLVLGLDRRPVDDFVLVVIRGDGKRVTIGSDCGNAPNCTPVPAAAPQP